MTTRKSTTPETVFMGTPALAVPALRVLAERSRLRLVVTRPARRAGRGRRPTEPAVHAAATALGLSVRQPETWTPELLEIIAADLLVVMAYGRILPPAVLAAARVAPINLHCSLLPRWRGASPLQAAIRAGDECTGVSVMRIERRLDAGPVYRSRSFPLPATADLPWLHDRMADCAAEALAEFLDDYPPGAPMPQDEDGATYCRKLRATDGEVDFAVDCHAVERQVRAYVPTPGCWCRTEAGRINLLRLTARPWVTDLPQAGGTVRGGEILVGCAPGAVAVERLQLPGRRPLAAAAFLNGHPCPGRWRVDPDAVPGG